MNRRIGLIIILLCLLIFATACMRKNDIDNNEKEEAFISESLTDVYFKLIKDIYNEDTALNSGNYMAVDLSQVLLDDKAELIEKIAEFASDMEKELLLNTRFELTQLGYISDGNFNEGFLISIRDIELSDTMLNTSVEKYVSGEGAIGYSFKVERINGEWGIPKIIDAWIS